MKIWTLEQEAENLKARFQGVTRAAFAREHKLKGGQAMIYQHINAMRPIGLDAALVYAKGFGCHLEEISPRLAKEVMEASLTTGPQERQLDSWAPAHEASSLTPTEVEWLGLLRNLAPHDITEFSALIRERQARNCAVVEAMCGARPGVTPTVRDVLAMRDLIGTPEMIRSNDEAKTPSGKK